MSTNTIITLPRDIGSRSIVRRALTQSPIAGTDVVIDAGRVERHGSAGVDELVKALLTADIQRVITVNASASFSRALTVVHRARTRPERTFLLTFREISAEALLRPA